MLLTSGTGTIRMTVNGESLTVAAMDLNYYHERTIQQAIELKCQERWGEGVLVRGWADQWVWLATSREVAV